MRHVRNMAGLGLILYVWGILTGYVPNWVCVMVAIGGMTLQFSDFYWGRTKGGGLFLDLSRSAGIFQLHALSVSG